MDNDVEIPWGTGVEEWWDLSYPLESCPGVSGIAAKSLAE